MTSIRRRHYIVVYKDEKRREKCQSTELAAEAVKMKANSAIATKPAPADVRKASPALADVNVTAAAAATRIRKLLLNSAAP